MAARCCPAVGQPAVPQAPGPNRPGCPHTLGPAAFRSGSERITGYSDTGGPKASVRHKFGYGGLLPRNASLSAGSRVTESNRVCSFEG